MTGRINTTNGFTLIELLVVVAIISLLVSILLPSLRRAQDLAKVAVCASNQRGLVLSLHNYGAESEGQLPGASGYDSTVPNRGVEGSGDSVDVLFPEYISNPDGFYCPAGVFGPEDTCSSEMSGFDGTYFDFHDSGSAERHFFISYCIYANAREVPGVYEEAPKSLESTSSWVLVSDYNVWQVNFVGYVNANHPGYAFWKSGGWGSAVNETNGLNVGLLDGSVHFHPDNTTSLTFPLGWNDAWIRW